MGISQKWKDTIGKAINDARWDEYDAIITGEVSSYENRFPALCGKVDWRLIKAMLWTESGGPDNPAWKGRALQIGNSGDPAYDVLKSGEENTSIIMTEILKKKIKTQSINRPSLNIQAAIAYLYARMSKSSTISAKSLTDTKVYTYEVVGGDSLEKIAKKLGTTVDELKARNSKASGTIYPKMEFQYMKANLKKIIYAWRDFSAANIAERYNGGGDENYETKLNYIVKEILPKLIRK